jgi:hypothetical protein
MTVLDIISAALRINGILAAGETASNNECNDALISLNNMVDTWSTEKMLIYATIQETFSLVVNQGAYQMGSGAPDFNTVRPQKIENIVWQQPTGSYPFNLGIKIVTQDQWASIGVPTITSTIPTHMWPQYTNPYVTLNFWPVPQAVNNIVIWSWKPLTDFSSLTQTVTLPPGYQKAIIYNLALELAPEYGSTPSELVLVQAAESKAAIKRMNNSQNMLLADAAMLNRKPSWNWMTGE